MGRTDKRSTGRRRMDLLLIVSLLVMVNLCHTSLDATLNEHWELWKNHHRKSYGSQAREAHRRVVWENNWRLIEKHNLEASLGLHSFTMGLNHLADMTEEEMDATLNCLREEPDDLQSGNHTFEPPQNATLPLSMDWRTQGLVTPVRNQGSCGCCWAFSAVGALEGQIKKQTGKMIPLSPQNLVDCSISYGNHGCKGGYLSKAFNYIIGNKGIDSEVFYPYKGKQGMCHYSVMGKAGDCRGYKILPSGNEKMLQYVVSAVGPVSVGMNSKLSSFQFYRGGIYNDLKCSNLKTNHAVLVVGYGTDNGQDYWLVKNSWGTAWGENGFFRMARNKNNLCGIANFPIYPVV
ncbi:cathepsin L1-like [Arapaima gigas]